MSFRRRLCCAVWASFLLSPPAHAQGITQLFHAELAPRSECPSGLRRAPASADELKACIKQLAVDVGATPDATGASAISLRSLRTARSASPRENALIVVDENTQVLQYYAAFIAAREFLNADKAAAADEKRLLDDVGEAVHRALQERDLEETAVVAGELRAGSALSNPGRIGNSSAGADTGSDTVALAHIVWTTTHAGAADKTHGADADFSGAFGLQPAMTVLKTSAGALDPKYQQALVITAAVDVNGFTGRREVGVSARGGFVRLGQISQIVEHDGVSELAIPAGSSDRVAPFFEVAARLSLFDRPMALVHLTHGELSPRFWTEAAFRHDARFDDLTQVASNKGAVMWRLMVDGVKIVDKRTAPVGNKTFDASFGFEYQKGLSGLPDGFSFLIRGDVDLLKALQGGPATGK